MQIFLNLLPTEKKDTIARRFYSRFFLWQSGLLLMLVLFYTGILGGMYALLRFQITSTKTANAAANATREESKRLAHYQEVFKRVNSSTELIHKYAEKHLYWSMLFQLLNRITPEGVAFTELYTKDFTVSLIGKAHTREQFLAFEEELKKSDCTTDVKAPLSNLFSETEVEFHVDFDVKRECLLNIETQ